MTISVWLDSGSDKPVEETDVLVVGAGVAGAGCAWWLHRLGLSTIVVDSGSPAAGATGRSAGFVLRGIIPYYNQAVAQYGRQNARWIFRLTEETQQHLLTFDQLYQHTIQMERAGSYLLASSLEELKDLEESAELMREDGFDVEYLRDDPIDRGFYGALFNPGDLGLHPGLLVEALLSVSGASIAGDEEVYRIDCNSNQVHVHTSKRLIKAGKVLLTINAYLPLLMPNFVEHLKIERGQCLVTRPLKERILQRLCYANYGFEYFRQLHDGRLLLGGCREPFRKEEIGYADTVTANVQTALHNYIKDKFPEVGGSPIDYRWSGVMAFTPDGLPLLGELNDKPGVFFLAGCNGHGLSYSLSLSKLLVDVALNESVAGIFDAARLTAPASK